LFKFLTSTIFAKVVMALTGLVIVGFLFVHAIGNLQFFISSDAYNAYAYFLQHPLGLHEFLWLIRLVLILCIILHIISAIYLRIYNNAAKPNHYRVKNYVKSKLTARTMLWTGLLILTGLIFHLLHFTAGWVDFNNGTNKHEIYSTGYYALNTECKDECCAIKCEKCDSGKEMCDSCKAKLSQNSKSQMASFDKIFQTTADGVKTFICEVIITDGKRFAIYGNDTISIDDYCKRTGQEWKDVKIEDVVLSYLKEKECCAETSTTKKDCCEEKCSNCCVSLSDCEGAMPVFKERPDVYGTVKAEFSNVWVAIFYTLFVILVGFHLNHAIQSAVHTIGIQGPKFTPVMRIASICLSIILVLLFCALPLGITTINFLGMFGIDIPFSFLGGLL